MLHANSPAWRKTLLVEAGCFPSVLDGQLRLLDSQERSKSETGHNYFQILAIRSGQLNLEWEDQTVLLEAQQVALIAPDTPYRLVTPAEAAFIQIDFGFSNLIDAPYRTERSFQLTRFSFRREASDRLYPSIYRPNAEASQQIYALTESLLQEILHPRSDSEPISDLALLQAVFYFNRAFETDWAQTHRMWTGKLHELIRYSRDYICHNYHRDLTIAEVAQVVYLSTGYFTRTFHEETGLTPQTFLIQVRIANACLLLQQQEHFKVQSIATMVGFSSPQRFNSAFRKQMGMSPRAYRLACQNRMEMQDSEEDWLE